MRREKAATPGKRRPTHLVVQKEAKQTLVRAPLLPHEHDESANEPKSLPDENVVQGYVDVASGLVDTDRRQDARRVFDASRRNKSRTR
jgi:hypothetical protein